MVKVAAHYRPGTYPRGEDTRRRILETAIEVFARDGYEGASTRKLAEEAGVNLPAIQYYFGSKEGLHRAAIAHIVEQIEQRLAPVAAQIRAALARGSLARAELLGLLYGMLDAFIAMVVDKEQQQPASRRLLIARAEAECSAALDVLHDTVAAQLVVPCGALVARLIGRPAEDEETLLRTLTILGQITIFCNKGALRTLGCKDISAKQLAAIRAIVHQQTEAMIDSVTRDGP
jgi:TetR/AcrR family transcriptional regulator, regulator of cefoperazone and chloramphenicol sensitivity